MFSTRPTGAKAFDAEQPIIKFKKLLFKTKTIEKRLGKRIDTNKLINKATNNLNRIRSVEYGL